MIPPAQPDATGYGAGNGYAQAQPTMDPAYASQARRIRFNGRPATESDLQIVAQLEARAGTPLADGDYWYDNASGLAGSWGGPATISLAAGLGLGGPLPAEASGGGTGVFVNGRELHPQDVRGLGGNVVPGRYWLDGQGNVGFEGGPAIGNVLAARQQQQQQNRPADGACGGHMGPFATIRRGNEVAAYCRNLGHSVGQTYHNGDGYYIDVQ